MKTIAGIDLGQSHKKKTSGVCVLNNEGSVVDTLSTSLLNEIIQFINKYSCCSAYIDAPLTLPFDKNEGVYFNREAEAKLMKRRSGYSVNPSFSPLSTNMLAVLGERAMILKDRLINETTVKRVYEVHPRTTCEYLAIEHFKTDKKKFVFKFNINSNIDTRLIDNEHVLDAVICAYAGYLRGQNKTIFIGNEDEGQILVPAPAEIKCVIFDMDGTLTNVKSPWQKVFEDNGIWLGEGENYLQEYLDKKFNYKIFCEKDIALWHSKSINREIIENSLNGIDINPYAVEVIKELAAKGIKCIIISTGFYYTAEKIVKAAGLKYEEGLKDLSSNTVSVFANDVLDGRDKLKLRIDVWGDEGHKKGKGEILKKSLKKLKIGPVRSLAVGDSYTSDKELFDIAGDFVYIEKEKDILKVLDKVNVSYSI